MLEKLLMAAMGKTTVERLVKQELERLEQGGFLDKKELERLSTECLTALEGRVEKARGLMGPLLGGVGERLRDALDMPSRGEVQALREALERVERSTKPGADTTAR